MIQLVGKVPRSAKPLKGEWLAQTPPELLGPMLADRLRPSELRRQQALGPQYLLLQMLLHYRFLVYDHISLVEILAAVSNPALPLDE